MRRLCSLLSVIALASLFTCVVGGTTPVGVSPPPPGPPQGPPQPPPAAQPTVTPIVDEKGQTYQISQGVAGAPEVVGCADGQREAFVDAAQFPTIAGCIGEWTGRAHLRTPTSRTACGDDAGPCKVPADACAGGWHMCGSTGRNSDLLRVSPDQCEQAGGGRFVAAISHCQTQDGCKYAPAETGSYACFERGWCSEPVCCGNDCGQFGVCRDGIWPGKTHIPVGTDQGCGSIGSSRARGVLCCKD